MAAGDMRRSAVVLMACALFVHRVSPSGIGGIGGGIGGGGLTSIGVTGVGLGLTAPGGIGHGGLSDSKHSQYEKDAANSLNGQSLNQESHRGDKVSENQNSLSDNKNTHFVGAKDNGHFVNQDVNKKLYDDSKSVTGQNFNQDFGEQAHGAAQKKAHKKGHHNSGFRNSYHKDETSNNSSFFDDYSDESDQSQIKNGRGKYGNEFDKRYDTRKEDGIRHVQDNARHGSYDRHGGTDARNADHRDYDRKNYNHDRRDANQIHRGQSYGGRDREYNRVEAAPHYNNHNPYYYERPPRPYPVDYHHRRPYYDDDVRLSAHPSELRRSDGGGEFRDRRQTITIYEDPRFNDGNPGRDIARQSTDYVQLEVRPGGQRFQRYDKYYEPPPVSRDWQRRSDINPLVLNRYNRY